jgi:hypothetical protein
MKIRHCIIAALLSFSLPAVADFTTVAEAYELALSNVRVPATPSSGIMFKKCDDCDFETIRVTPATRYEVDGQPVTLKEFRERAFGVSDRAAKTVIVLHDFKSDTVTRVSM